MKLKRLISIILLAALCASVCLFASCGDEPAPIVESSTEAENTAAEPAPAKLYLTEGGKAQYAIVRPESASDSIVQGGIALRKLVNKVLKVEFELKSDWFKPGSADHVGAREILIGSCDREESRAFIATLFKIKKQISMTSAGDYTGQGLDCDDNYIYMPLSRGTSTSDNVIVVYEWDSGYFKTLHLDTSAESETMINYKGKYYINFNSDGAKIYELHFNISY